MPGHGKQALLRNTDALKLHENKGSQFVTTSGVSVKCLPLADGGGQGFVATTPDGTIYTFDRFIEHRYTDMEYTGYPEPNDAFTRYMSMVVATRATDVHGNTVDYDYDITGRLTAIYGNDGRRIDFGYSGSEKRISYVEANGRRWNYVYEQDLVHLDYWEGQNVTLTIPSTLRTVTQPDGRAWTYDLVQMNAPAPAADTCHSAGTSMSVTHPYGTVGTFTMTPRLHRVSFNKPSLRDRGLLPTYCPYFGTDGGNFNDFGDPVPNPPLNPLPPIEYLAPIFVMSIGTKTLTGPGLPSMAWTYRYEWDLGGIGSSSNDRTNWTEIEQPDGTVHTYNHVWGTENFFGGKLLRKKITSAATTVMREEEYEYFREGGHGSGTVCCSKYSFWEAVTYRQTRAAINQGGDNYVTETDYNSDFSLTGYSFGAPTQVTQHSLNGPNRVFNYEYEHKAGPWILSLPKTVSQGSTQVVSYNYDTLGQKTSQSRYTQANYYTFEYHADGTPLTVTDAVGRVTRATNWKRGSAQNIWKAYGTADQTYVRQYIDDNGWMTRQDDALGNAHQYSYDSMGRLTLLNPPGAFSNTVFSYSFPTAGGAVQTTTRDNAKTTVTYDAMFRPTLTRTQALDTGWSSYVNMDYDAMGRAVFASQPSSSAVESNGVDTTYDALGRVLSVSENVAPNATTSYAYLSSNRTAVTDAAGKVTTTWKDGYGGPGGGEVIMIQQPEGVTTDIVLNIWNKVTSVTQSGGGASLTQNYYYDARQRLCRYVTPESGHAIYKYDNAGQLTNYARGVAAGTSCANPSGNDRVELTYWPTGTLKETKFTDPGTPDIYRDYDANGNLTKMFRGAASEAVQWLYYYDDLNNLTREALHIDGRLYNTTYGYNTQGHITQKTLPGGSVINHTLDALGRDLDVEIGSSTLMQNAAYHASGALTGLTYGNGFIYAMTPNARLQPAQIRAVKSGTLAYDQSFAYTARGKLSSVTDAADTANSRTYAYDDLGRLDVAYGPWGHGTFIYDALGNLLEKDLRSFKKVTNSYDPVTNRAVQTFENWVGGGGLVRAVSHDTRGNVTALGDIAMTYDRADQPDSMVIGGSSPSSGKTIDYRYDGHLKRVRAVKTPTAAQAAVMGGGGGFGAMSQSSAISGSSAMRASATRSLQTTDITQLMPASPVYADRARSGFGAYREVEAEPRRSAERLTPLAEAQGLMARSAERTSSGPLATDRLVPLSGAAPLNGGTMSSMSSGCTGPTDETIYNVYNAAGQLVLVDKAHLCQMTLYVQGAGTTVTRIEVDTAASTLTRTYLHPDHLGSAAAGTSQSGTVLWREQYTPYGEKLTAPAANDNQGSFTGHIDDADTGLTYMQARYYDPSFARFLSVDPVGFLDAGDPRYFNRYSYTANDPINLVDPTGECFASRLRSCAEQAGQAFEKVAASVSRGVQAAQRDPESFKEGVGKGILNGASDTVNGAVTLGEIGSPNLKVGQVPDIPRIEQGSNEAENFGMVVGETGFHAGTVALGAPKAAGLAGQAANASKGALGKHGALFGRGGNSGGGVFNSNNAIRVGYGWKGGAKTGNDVFRVAWGNKRSKFHGHIVLHTFKKPLP